MDDPAIRDHHRDRATGVEIHQRITLQQKICDCARCDAADALTQAQRVGGPGPRHPEALEVGEPGLAAVLRAAGGNLEVCGFMDVFPAVRGCIYNDLRITTMDLQARRQEILEVAARHGARNVRLFGSVARGDDRPGSDVDLLVEMAPGRSLLDLVGLGQDLEDLLHRSVDVLTEASLHPSLRERILAEARPL